jgi:acetolactate synthase I/II/III large subunit
MAQILAGHAAARFLRAARVPWVAGVPGESFLPLLDGLRLEDLPYLATVHESGATFLAAAYARATGQPAVVAVTRGPGASNAMIGLHEAQQAGAPVVLIIGQLESRVRGRRALQEMEFEQVFASIAKRSIEVTRPDRIVPAIAAALRLSTTSPTGPVVISVPSDHWYGLVSDEPTAISTPASVPLLSDSALDALAELCGAARRGVFIVGEAFQAGKESDLLAAVAERTGFGVLGGHVFPDAMDADGAEGLAWLGASTVRGSAVLRETLAEADTCIFLDHWPGDRVTQGYRPLSATLAVVARDVAIGWDEYPETRILLGDPVDALRRLLDVLPADADAAGGGRAWVAGRKRKAADLAASTLEGSRSAASGIPFTDIVAALAATLPEAVTLVSDAGSFNDWVMRYLPFPGGRHYIGPISGSMGFAVPGAIGAQLARPESRTLALTGDGGFLMTGMEVATLVQLQMPVTVIVFRNDLWGSIAIHQDRDFPGARFATELPPVSFVGLAEALGATGLRVEDSAGLRPALAEAFASPTPVVVEIATDPERPAPTSYEGR